MGDQTADEALWPAEWEYSDDEGIDLVSYLKSKFDYASFRYSLPVIPRDREAPRAGSRALSVRRDRRRNAAVHIRLVAAAAA